MVVVSSEALSPYREGDQDAVWLGRRLGRDYSAVHVMRWEIGQQLWAWGSDLLALHSSSRNGGFCKLELENTVLSFVVNDRPCEGHMHGIPGRVRLAVSRLPVKLAVQNM